MTPMTRPIKLIAIPILLATVAVAQGPVDSQEYDLDSGVRNNPLGTPSMVFSGEVTVPSAPWLRLFLSDTNLPSGSWLLLSSKEDNAVQRFDAASLQDYSFSSAVFNGDTVRVRLVAGPGTQGNRVSVSVVHVGSVVDNPEDTLCGTDDRVLSSDKRVARGYVSGCTMFLVNEHTMVTAGHCVGLNLPGIGPLTDLAMFEVPLSGPDGGWNFPPPDHQYPLDLSTLTMQDNGHGQDWAVVSSFRNSNHGRYAGQNQEGWFRIGNVPTAATIDQESIRITGHGEIETGPITWNAAQTTQVGPGVDVTPTEVLYRTDTSNGTSGSPIILESTDEVIGVHTHGGCESIGANRGTRIDVPGLAAAIITVSNSVEAGSVTVFGAGCGGTLGVPALSASGVADIGGRVDLTVSRAPPNQLGVFALGFSGTHFFGFELPLLLDFWGLEGCTLFTSAEVQLPVSTSFGFLNLPIHIPGNPFLIGKDVFVQFIGLDEGAPNTLGAVASDAIRVHIGG